MSIYATHFVFQIERYNRAINPPFELVKVYVQGVPGHVGHPSEGYGDPFASFLPPPPDTPDKLRAVVFVTEGCPKVGQQYTWPLLVLSGEEFQRIPFQEVMAKVSRALELEGGR
jgi:hypothetical protein